VKILSNIRGIIRNAHPDHHAIAKGMASVALFVFLGKLAGASKEMAIAYRYGISAEVDAYLLIFNLISWPVSIWLSVLSFVLIPLIAQIQRNNLTDIPKFRAELLAFTLLLGLNLTLVFRLGLPALLSSSWLGLSAFTQRAALNTIPSMLVLAPLGLLINLFSVWLLSAGRHLNTLLEGIPALVILMTVLLLPHHGIEALVWGTVVGSIFHLIGIAIPLAQQDEIEKPSFTQHTAQWSVFWQGFGIILVGQTLMSFATLVDQFFAARLNIGAIATLSYAGRIMALILGLGATAIGRATLPIFSRIQADGDNKLHEITSRWTNILFMIGLVAMLMAWWLAPWCVKLLFERGAFTAENTKAVVDVFRYSSIQLPFYFAGLVCYTALSSYGAHKAMLLVSIMCLLVKGGANFLLIPMLGLISIPISTALMYAVFFLMSKLAVSAFFSKNYKGFY
jgi:peptidoglycan biosynthesis protein MviN/MurJ (putative lipid II flippase)